MAKMGIAWDRMRYHSLVINLCNDNFGTDVTASDNSERRIPMRSNMESGLNTVEVSVQSARAIADLVEVLRTDYGMRYAHQFAMYAINVALYTLLEQDAFDLYDQDFLSLTGAFSAIARLSQVGRRLFHLFKLSVRSRSHMESEQSSDKTPWEIKELLRHDAQFQSSEQWNHYAEWLTRLNDQSKCTDTLKENIYGHPSSGLKEMLEQYEKLSVGEEEARIEKHRADEFLFSG